MEDNAAIIDFIRKCPTDVLLMLKLYAVELGSAMVGEIIGQRFLKYKKHYVEREHPLDRKLTSLTLYPQCPL